MLATYYTLSKDSAPTPEEMRQKSREYMLMKPKRYSYSDNRNTQGGNQPQRSSWYKPRDDMNLDESDQFILGRDFTRNFDVTIDLNNAMFRIRNTDRRYAIKPVNLLMANENKAPVFLSRRVRLKANEAAIVSLQMKNYNELSDNKQVCIVPNPNSQSAAVLGRSFSITKSGLCVSVLLNTLDIPITIQRGRKLGYALPVKTRYEMTENQKQN